MFIPLHVKSDYSLGYGTASVDELVDGAAALGYPVLALTDLENLYGQVRFHYACRIRGVRPLTGVELRYGFDGRRNVGRLPGRVVLLAADETGYGNLCRIVSRRRGVARGRITEEISDPLPLITRYPEGLFALSDDAYVMEQLAASGKFTIERLGLLLIRPDGKSAEGVRESARRLGVRLVADLDSVFLKEEDHPLHALQRAIQRGVRLSEVADGVDIESTGRWLHSPAEAVALFADVPQAVTAAAEIAEACRLDLTTMKGCLPGSDHASERLRELCEEALAEQTWSWTEIHCRRLDEELALFDHLGFSGILLAVAEILAHCRKTGIPVVVRGSAVSSLALHLLGASPVDPLSHGLLFERFLHAGKSAWPDVDIDLPWHRRDEVIDWVYQRFGRDRVAMVAAHHTFKRRSALREGLKAWGARPALIESMSRALPPDDLAVEEVDFLNLSESLPESEPVAEKTFDREGERGGLAKILPLIQRLVGRPHHIAVHPGGIVVGGRCLEELLPLERAPKGVVITQYDAIAVDRLGLVKIDLLGNRCLSEIEEALEFVGEGKPLRLESIPLEDPPTLALIDRAETIGCFQLESPAMRSLLARLPIRNQSDIIAALALIRPGAAAGEVKATFVRRARGEEPAEPAFELIADRLRETCGLLLYEEDIMVLLSRTGGLTLGEADEMRGAIVKSGGDPAILSALEAEFAEGAKSRGATDDEVKLARRAWATATRFAAYSFNKAHAASFARLAYFSAYTKAHYPLEFACALLNHHQGLYPLRTEAGELVRMGIELRSPHVNASEYHSRCEERDSEGGMGAVRIGLDKIKGLSLRAAFELLEERTSRGGFASLRNLLERVRLSRSEVSALVLSGACDGLFPLTAANYPFAHEASLEKLRQGCKPAELDFLPIPRPTAAAAGRVQLYQALVRVRNELRYLEMHLQAHPMALLRREAGRYRCVTVAEAISAPAGAALRLAVTIAAMRRVPTRQGTMQFLSVEDETGILEAAVLPPAFLRLGEQVTTPGPFLVEGKLRRQQGGVHLEVGQLGPFHKRQRPFSL